MHNTRLGQSMVELIGTLDFLVFLHFFNGFFFLVSRCATTFSYDLHGKWGNCMNVKCFKLVDLRMTYEQGRGYCASENAILASITTDLEQGKASFPIKFPQKITE